MYIEQLRQPRRFLTLAKLAHDRGKTLIMLNPGATQQARDAMYSHTGAKTEGRESTRSLLAKASVVVVNSLEELLDVSYLSAMWRADRRGRIFLACESGALCSIMLDMLSEKQNVLCQLASESRAALQASVPSFIIPRNPMDLTAQPLADSWIYARVLDVMLPDTNAGAVLLSLILSDEETWTAKLPTILETFLRHASSTLVISSVDSSGPIPLCFVEELRRNSIPFFPSTERALRALSRLARNRDTS